MRSHRSVLSAASAAALLLGTAGSALAQDVDVTITSDNAYGFGYGDANSLANYFGGVGNTSAGQIFNCPVGNGPEFYPVPAAAAGAGNFLYIMAWADKSTTQGVIGQFVRVGSNTPIYTGQGPWELCATGQDFSPQSGGPSQAQIDAQIQRCNEGQTPSLGWVDTAGNGVSSLQFGEDNTTPRLSAVPGNEFPIVCGIDPDARWMWHNWDPGNISWPTQSPFIWPVGNLTNVDSQFLIFRLPADEVPPGDCMETQPGVVLCDFDADGLTGTYSVNVTVTNNSGQDVSYIMLPGGQTVPNVITLPSPLPDGQSTTINITLDPAHPTADEVCFPIVLGNQEFEECCADEICVPLPDCDCVQGRVRTRCNDDGTFDLQMALSNLSPDDVEHVFLIPPSGVTATPDYFDVPTAAPFTSFLVGPSTIAGATPGAELCILVTLHDEEFGECCAEEICFDAPICDGSGGNGGGNGTGNGGIDSTDGASTDRPGQRRGRGAEAATRAEGPEQLAGGEGDLSSLNPGAPTQRLEGGDGAAGCSASAATQPGGLALMVLALGLVLRRRRH